MHALRNDLGGIRMPGPFDHSAMQHAWHRIPRAAAAACLCATAATAATAALWGTASAAPPAAPAALKVPTAPAAAVAAVAAARASDLATTIEFVAAASAPARRPDEGLLVLDLEGLESAEAALSMAASWRQRHGGARSLICWLRASGRGQAAEALGVLTQAESPPCTRILLPR